MEHSISFIARHFRQFWFEDIRDILALTAESLQNVKFPAESLQDLKSLDTKQLVSLLPACTVVCFVTILIIQLLYSALSGTQFLANKSCKRDITSACIIRVMGLIYLFAFLSNAYQFKALYGSNGLASAMDTVNKTGFARPSPIFAFFGLSDEVLDLASWAGVLVSAAICLTPLHKKVNFVFPLFLWLVYLSIVNLGVGYLINYGWEWLTLELGFLVIFLCPILNEDIPEANTTIVFWLLKWSGFRLMFGAGMSKMGLGSSQCWKDLDCLTSHYETQPMPNPLSFYFHHFPVWFHKVEGLLVLLEQIIFPFLLFFPNRRVQMFLCLSELILMSGIAGTGNYAWINILGFLPFISCLDDDFVLFRYYLSYIGKANNAHAPSHVAAVSDPSQSLLTPLNDKEVLCRDSVKPNIFYQCIGKLRVIASVALFFLIARLSVNPVKELFARQPWLHFYDDYFLVNANGLFGFVNRERIVLTLEFSSQDLSQLLPCQDTSNLRNQNGQLVLCSDLSDLCGQNAQVDSLCASTCGRCVSSKSISSMDWTPVEFQNLPGALNQRPKFTSPYHYRFDWEVWIYTTASMEGQTPSGSLPPFIKKAVGKLLFEDAEVKTLFSNGYNISNATAIKSSYYRYTFSNESAFSIGTNWWHRDEFKDSVRVWTRDSFGSGNRDVAMRDLGVIQASYACPYPPAVLSLLCVYIVLQYYHFKKIF